jgi:hypothetical protein
MAHVEARGTRSRERLVVPYLYCGFGEKPGQILGNKFKPEMAVFWV